MAYSDQDKIDVSRCLSKLAMLKGRPLSKEELVVFTEQCALDGILPKQLSKACYEISRDKTICFLSYHALYNQIFPQLPQAEEALLAWEKINHHIRQSGYTALPSSLPFDQKTQRGIRALGGWKALCSCSNEQDLVWKKRAFLEHYKAATQHQQIELSHLEYMRLSGKSAIEIEKNRMNVNSLVKSISVVKTLSDEKTTLRGEGLK